MPGQVRGATETMRPTVSHDAWEDGGANDDDDDDDDAAAAAAAAAADWEGSE